MAGTSENPARVCLFCLFRKTLKVDMFFVGYDQQRDFCTFFLTLKTFIYYDEKETYVIHDGFISFIANL